MSLQDLLDPDFLISALGGLYILHRMDLGCYRIFNERFSYSQDILKNAQFWEKYADKLLSEEKLPENNSKVLDTKQHVIELYKSLEDKFVPKFFLFSRPFFYFKAKKELSHMGEEIERRLKELKAA